jgi:drug/metabolite transporter (DMT)-like permease
MRPRQLATYLFLAATWGLSFLMLDRAVDAFGWAGAVSFRCILAGILLIGAARLAGRQLDFALPRKDVAIVGLTTVAGQLVFLSIATPLIGTAMASIFVAAIPLFSMLISQALGMEQITRRGLAGIVLGATGIVMLVGFPAVPITGTFLFGCSCALLSALFAAYGSNHVSYRLKNAGAWELTATTSLTGGVATLPALLFVPVPGSISLEAFGWLFALAAIVSALNYVLYFRLVAEIGATKAISVEFLVTIVAVIVGTLLLGEQLSLAQFAGAAVIIAGCALVLGLFRSKEPDFHG